MKLKIYKAIACLFIAVTAFAQQDLYHIKYGADSQQQQLDLFLPKTITATTPVVIMLHGGAWSMGGNEYTDKHARDLRDRGFVVANVDYRYADAKVHGKDLLNDIDNAVGWVENNAKKYGYKPKGYHMAGVSAGAHLSLLYGYTSKRGIKSINALCAPINFGTEEIMAALKKEGLLQTIENLAGAKYTPGNLDPFKAVSPYWQITKVPTQLIHGDADPVVDYSQSVALHAKLQELKVPSNFITQKGKGHDVGMNQPDSEKLNIDSIEAWVKKHD